MIGQLVCLGLVLHNGKNNTIQLKSLQIAVSISPPVPPGSKYFALFGACFSEKSKRPVFWQWQKTYICENRKTCLNKPCHKVKAKVSKTRGFQDCTEVGK